MIRILDLFCGAGGAAVGYAKACDELGIPYEIIGVDRRPQPRYPFKFIQGDAIQFLGYDQWNFDFIHASPPCPAYSTATPPSEKQRHPDLLDVTRGMLRESGAPYVIENVAGAKKRMISPVLFCGTMFQGLRVFRHRYFEISGFYMDIPGFCNHAGKSTGRSPGGRAGKPGVPGEGGFVTVSGHPGNLDYCRMAMGIDWPMSQREIVNAIPPAYTQYIGVYAFRQIANNQE